MQIRKEGDLSAFHKVDPPLLWFLNTTGCRRRLALACFADDSVCRNLAPKMSCCDNCLYSLYKSANVEEDSGVPEWELHDVIMRYSLHYLETNKQHKRQEDIKIAKEIDIRTTRLALKEGEKAHEYNLAGQTSTAAEKAAIAKQRMEGCEKICKKALDRFAIETWPDGMDDIMFPYKWRAKLAKRAVLIKLATDLVKVLKANCNLATLGIQDEIFLILVVILLAVENQDCQMEIAIRQNLVFAGAENVDTLQQNKPRRPKRKQNGLDEGAQEVQLEKIRMQAIRAVVKKVKMAAKKAQSTKVKNAVTTRDNAKKIFTKKREKTTRKKEETNETPDVSTATQENEGRILPPN